MHPLLVNFNIISGWEPIVGSEESAVKFATEIGLIPPKNALMLCPLCGCEATGVSDKTKKAGFLYICKNKSRKQRCKGNIQPLKNTFFEGSSISIRDTLAIIICYVYKFSVAFTCTEICAWRKSRGESLPIHCQTIAEYYHRCELVETACKSQKSEASENTDLIQGSPSGRKSKGEKIYDFLIAMKRVYPGPCQVGLEI